jgi:PAS domain S-box-containing protein
MPPTDPSTDDLRLIESEQRYQTVIQNASDMIQSVRPDGTFEFVNKAWHDRLGYTAEDLPGLIVWDIIHPDAIEHCQELFAMAVTGETIPFMETTFRTKDGDPVPVEGNVSSRFLGNTVVATHGFFRDITERLRAQELEARNLQLERDKRARYLEKMAALGKLSAGLAHELNNPAAAAQRAGSRLTESLTRRDAAMRDLIGAGLAPGQWQAIETLLADGLAPGALSPLEISDRETAVEEWLEDHGVDGAWDLAPALVQAGIVADRLDAFAAQVPATALAAAVHWQAEGQAVREIAEVIVRSSHRISELVRAVKGYSYMDRATEQHVDLHEGLESTILILGHRLRDVTIVRDYDRSLPAIRVLGSSLNQVWTNMLDNAIDATGGTGTVTIRTRHDTEHGAAVVEIEDDGCGIPPEDQARIFEPFFTTKPQGQGTGLGLDTVWRIVTEEHGGTITVDSERGRTVFRVTLPLTGPGVS